MGARGAATALSVPHAQPPPASSPSLAPQPLQVRCESSSSPSSTGGGGFGDLLPSGDCRRSLRLWNSRPQGSWVVRTESNVQKWKRRTPEPPCVVCNGSSKVECSPCQGKGRENHIDLMMLPKGEWPIWCRTCRGSGLDFCSRCLGTGEYRERVGFLFMKTDEGDPGQPN